MTQHIHKWKMKTQVVLLLKKLYSEILIFSHTISYCNSRLFHIVILGYSTHLNTNILLYNTLF